MKGKNKTLRLVLLLMFLVGMTQLLLQDFKVIHHTNIFLAIIGLIGAVGFLALSVATRSNKG